VQLRDNIEQLVAEFDVSKFGKAPTMYDVEDIFRLNTKALHETDFAEVKDRLPETMTKDFWNAVRLNVENVDDAVLWWKICNEEVSASDSASDRDFLKEAADTLPQTLDEKAWDIWVNELKVKTGRKGKNLFMPLRVALTGMEHGPELKNLLPLMGREIILKRLVA